MSEEEFRKKAHDMNYTDDEIDEIIEHRKEDMRLGINPPPFECIPLIEVYNDFC